MSHALVPTRGLGLFMPLRLRFQVMLEGGYSYPLDYLNSTDE